MLEPLLQDEHPPNFLIACLMGSDQINDLFIEYYSNVIEKMTQIDGLTVLVSLLLSFRQYRNRDFLKI